jgi:hypothetical protein
MSWSEVMSQIMVLSREGRWEELQDFLVRRGIAVVDEKPCIARKTFTVICVGDRVTVSYKGGVKTGIIAGFSMDGTSLLLIGCKGERLCQSVYPISVYLPYVSSISVKEFSPFHESYGARMLMEFLGFSEDSGGEG